jgi:hypothetical protein
VHPVITIGLHSAQVVLIGHHKASTFCSELGFLREELRRNSVTREWPVRQLSLDIVEHEAADHIVNGTIASCALARRRNHSRCRTTVHRIRVKTSWVGHPVQISAHPLILVAVVVAPTEKQRVHGWLCRARGKQRGGQPLSYAESIWDEIVLEYERAIGVTRGCRRKEPGSDRSSL